MLNVTDGKTYLIKEETVFEHSLKWNTKKSGVTEHGTDEKYNL